MVDSFKFIKSFHPIKITTQQTNAAEEKDTVKSTTHLIWQQWPMAIDSGTQERQASIQDKCPVDKSQPPPPMMNLNSDTGS